MGKLGGNQNSRVTDKVVYGGCSKIKTGGGGNKVKRLGDNLEKAKTTLDLTPTPSSWQSQGWREEKRKLVTK